jgi:voltage-gated potassium channel
MNIFQLFLTLLIFLIIADIILLVLVLVFPIKPIGFFEIAIFDTIVSFLLLLFIGINQFILNNINISNNSDFNYNNNNNLNNGINNSINHNYDANNKSNSSTNNNTNINNDYDNLNIYDIDHRLKYRFINYRILILIAILPLESLFVSILKISSNFYFINFLVIIGIFHIIGLLISLKFTGSRFIDFTKKNGLGYSIIIISIIFIFSALLFYIFENQINPNVSSFEDAIWYSIVAITTTGFGDIAPQTMGGRVMGSLLMISGVSFASFATASVAGSLIKKIKINRESTKQETKKQIAELKDEIAELKELIKKQNREKRG